jgi:MFS transporter, YNFM family, putative membrane transport protein
VTPADSDVGAGHARGTPGYRRLVAAVWAAGVGSFTLLYAPQALLPLISRDLGVSPSTAALTVSVTTGTLALALVPMSYLADRVGRTRLMTASLAVAAVLGLLAPLAPSMGLLLAVRAAQGIAIAGLPALAMAHVSEEVRPSSVGAAMGLFVAGNTVGGLTGRVLSSTVADVGGWRAGLAAVGALALVCVVAFRVLLPPPTAAASPAPQVDSLGHLGRHLRDPGVRRLCLSSFVLMAAFVTVYNYLGYRLLDDPFGLSPLLVGLVFITYLAGTTSSPVAGRLGDRFGRRAVLLAGVLLALGAAVLTLVEVLVVVLAGLVLFTVGFFVAHTSASGMVGNRARVGRAQASALYLLAYYAGSSIGGWVGGFAFEGGGWPAVVGYVAGLLVAALVLALLLLRTPPLVPVPARGTKTG